MSGGLGPEQVGPKQFEVLPPGVRDAVPLPLAHRRRLDLAKPCDSARVAEGDDDLCVWMLIWLAHGRIIGAPINVSIGSPMPYSRRLA